MANGTVFCPTSGVDVQVEVGSNRSFERLDLTECEDCRALFVESDILACVGSIQWAEVGDMEYLKSIVSCNIVEVIVFIQQFLQGCAPPTLGFQCPGSPKEGIHKWASQKCNVRDNFTDQAQLFVH